MAHSRESTDLMERIAKSVRDCGTWRAAGLSEKYLEAYSLMKALEAELVFVTIMTRISCKLLILGDEVNKKGGGFLHGSGPVRAIGPSPW